MSYTYLQEQGEESSVESFSDIPQSVLSRLNLSAEKSCSNDNATESCHDSPFGMMLRRLTDDRGEERLMWCAGGFPCQDISAAGKGRGINGQRSGLWAEMARIVGEIQPRYVFVENSPMLTSRGLDRVLGDLAMLGYDARWGVFGAHHVWLPHFRDRIWVGAYAGADAQSCPGKAERTIRRWENAGTYRLLSNGWGGIEPHLFRVGDGLAHDMDRIAAIGNGQVPAVAALAWRTLMPDEE